MDVMVAEDSFVGSEKLLTNRAWYLVPRFLVLLLFSNIFIRGTYDLWHTTVKRYHAGRQWANDLVFELRLCLPFRGWNKSIEGCAQYLRSRMTEDSPGSMQLHVQSTASVSPHQPSPPSTSPKSPASAPVSAFTRSRSTIAPTIPTRHQHRVRGSYIYTTWYESSGPSPIDAPPFVPPLPASPGEICVHNVLGGKHRQVWLWTQHGAWVPVPATGAAHPIVEDRYLVVTPSGRLSWVKPETLAHYQSRERKVVEL